MYLHLGRLPLRRGLGAKNQLEEHRKINCTKTIHKKQMCWWYIQRTDDVATGLSLTWPSDSRNSLQLSAVSVSSSASHANSSDTGSPAGSSVSQPNCPRPRVRPIYQGAHALRRWYCPWTSASCLPSGRSLEKVLLHLSFQATYF